MNAIANNFHQKIAAEAQTIEYQDLQLNVWYADAETGAIEPGTVHSARFSHDGTLKDFKVRFTEDFEAFEGEALGKCIFLSREDAEASLKKEG